MKLEHLERTLQDKNLHLGNPDKDWPDRNDSKCINMYSSQKNQSFPILGTCLTEASDRFHFWHIFGEKEKGVCLWFRKDKLIEDVQGDASLIFGNVQYKTTKDLIGVKAHQVPFIKRSQYEDEREFRILRISPANKTPIDKFSFSPSSLERIYLNPWLSTEGYKSEASKITRLLKNEINHVKLMQNRSLEKNEWLEAVAAVFKRDV